MLPEILFGIALIAAIFFAFQIFTGNKRLARLRDRESLDEKVWLDQHAHEFPGMSRIDIAAGLRFAGEGFNFSGTLLRPDDSWGTTLAPTTTKPSLDPALRDWEAVARARGIPPESMGTLTLRDFIAHHGPTPEAHALIEDGEKF